VSEVQAIGAATEDRIAVASNWQLVWWRFRRHHLALFSAGLLICLYLVVLCPDFFSTQDPQQTDARQAFIPVQALHFFGDGWNPWVPATVGKRNPVTLRMEWTTDPQRKVHIGFFNRGAPYRLFGLFETNIHLLGAVDPGQRIFLLGSDRLGRDQWSRIMHGTRTSMTVGLVAVTLSVIFGVVLGGVSGYFGGMVDQVIQRLIELLQSVPTIPIWLALSAALPRDWTPTQVFFAITVILSLVGWTTLGAKCAAVSSRSARRISCWRRASPAVAACGSFCDTWCRRSSATSSPPARSPFLWRSSTRPRCPSWASAFVRRRSAGACCCRRHRTSRRWHSHPGCSSRVSSSSSPCLRSTWWATACAMPPIPTATDIS